MNEIRANGRRAFLTRSASGLAALWASLDFGFGRGGWGVLLGAGPRRPALADYHAPAPTAEPLAPADIFRVNMDFVNGYVLIRENEVAIVDTGVAGNGARFAETVQAAGLGPDAVRHVILTHHHRDHVGSLAEVLDLMPTATVYAGEADIPQITAPREIVPLADGQEVFGLQIIATPGHTAGHVSVFDPAGSALITGDAAFNRDGILAVSPPQYSVDQAQAAESIRKLAGLTFDRALFMHGEPIETGASAAFMELAASL